MGSGVEVQGSLAYLEAHHKGRPPLQVALLPSAVSSDGTGQSASVTAANGNKARVKNVAGMFKDVSIRADQPGQYILRAKPSSREVCGTGLSS